MTKQHPGGVKSTSAQRLRETLATMVQQQGNGASPSALTATTLCELAGMSRNALYRYHPEVVQALHAAQQEHRPRIDGDRQAAQRLRRDNVGLREQIEDAGQKLGFDAGAGVAHRDAELAVGKAGCQPDRAVGG